MTEKFGTRINNRNLASWPYKKIHMEFHCSICGTTNNIFKTPDGRNVCIICRMKELGIDPAKVMKEQDDKRLEALSKRHDEN